MNWLARLINGANLTPKSLDAKVVGNELDDYEVNLVIARAEIAAAKAYLRSLSEADPVILKFIRDRMNEEIRGRMTDSQEVK